MLVGAVTYVKTSYNLMHARLTSLQPVNCIAASSLGLRRYVEDLLQCSHYVSKENTFGDFG